MIVLREILSPKILKYLRMLSNELSISEYLRGWSWWREPVRPPSESIKLSLSDVVNRYCQTMRDIYLKYVLNVEPKPTQGMLWGRVLHEVFKYTIELSRKILLNDGPLSGYEYLTTFEDEIDHIISKVINEVKNEVVDDKFISKLTKACENLIKFLIIQIASQIDLEIARNCKFSNEEFVNHVLPFFVEYRVDGSFIGLKDNLRIDLLSHNVIVEVKYGRNELFHKYALVGYALALESDIEIPVDYGIILYVNFNTDKLLPKIRIVPFVLSDDLRREFLELRDNAIEVILHERDPGKPNTCPIECPYRYYCIGE